MDKGENFHVHNILIIELSGSVDSYIAYLNSLSLSASVHNICYQICSFSLGNFALTYCWYFSNILPCK